MITRLAVVSVLILGAAAFVATDEAQAAPISPAGHTAVHFGPRIFVGGGVRVPIGGRSGYYREIVETVGGYYETRTREVQVPGEQIGWDLQGRPLYGPDRIEVQTYRVWVPRRQVVRRVWVARRHPVGHITIGGRVRLR